MNDIENKPFNLQSNDCRQTYIYSQKYNYNLIPASPDASQEMRCTLGHTFKHMKNWTEDETVAWMIDTIQSNDFSEADVPFYRFNITGEQLLTLTKAEIDQKMEHPNVPPTSSESISEFLYCQIHHQLNKRSTDLTEKIQILDREKSDDNSEDDIECNWCKPNRTNEFNSDEKSDSEDDKPIKRPPGRPRTSTVKEKKGTKNTLIVEFLRNLLLDRRYCPNIISWVNYSEGTFRFNNTVAVAKLWGDRNQNSKMDFGKFTRAMRYHYRSQKLVEHPARLIYQFGPNAPNFKTDNPNFEKP